jgi:hypothetical protein
LSCWELQPFWPKFFKTPALADEGACTLFEASLLSHFRQRLGEKLVGSVNESVIRKLRADSLGEDVASDAPPASCQSESEGEADWDSAEGEQEQLQLRREGRLVVDDLCPG